MNPTRALKSRMSNGEIVYGQLIGPGNDPFPTVEALKELGYDFVMIDREHSLVNPETVYAYVRAAAELEIPILMRPEEHYANWRCFLDTGINGLMLPMINAVDEVAQAVDRMYYPPLGHRGYGIGLSPYPLDGKDPAEVPHMQLTEYLNNNMVLFPQTETVNAVSNLREILQLEGVTGTIVGTYDLAADIGGIAPGTSRVQMTRSPSVEAKLSETARICRECGKVAGIGGVPPEDMARWAKEGYQLFMIGYVAEGRVEAVRVPLEKTRQLIGG